MKGLYKNIYVLAPYGYATGGVELAHQLVDYLRNRNQNAFIVYINGDKISSKQDITKEYSIYNISSSSYIEDKEDNILILPEVFFNQILSFKKIQVGCWWMSVDNHYKNSKISFYDAFYYERSIIGKIKILLSFLLKKNYQTKYSDKILYQEENRITHYYQSHYAQYHLYSKGYSKIRPLSDYINLELFGDIGKAKQNVVLYNPSKGYEFTKKIIEKLPEYKFVPLKGLTRYELKELFQTSKLYIDFGHFPGKDRLFREAAINGCCIVTGNLGASYFYEDVPISEAYKFKINRNNIDNIICKIKYIINNYELCYKDFQYLRYKIMQEKEVFFNEIEELFFYKNNL